MCYYSAWAHVWALGSESLANPYIYGILHQWVPTAATNIRKKTALICNAERIPSSSLPHLGNV